jgi:hypothetical protein
VTEFIDADPNGCTQSAADPNVGAPSVADLNGGAACVANVDDEEEEDEVPLTQKNSRQFIASGESSGVPSSALSALIGLQELSLANFDQTLEDMVPEDLLSEPANDGVMEVCADVLDAGLRSSRASSTLERDLEGQETDLDRPGPMEATEGPSALEAATAENLDPKNGVNTYPTPEDVAGDDLVKVGSANYDPAPEGVRAGSPSCTSMDVHAGSPLHSGCMVVAQALDQGVALEGSVPADRVLGSVDGTELVPAGSLQDASGGGLTPGHQLTSHDLGIPSFFSNLQVL